MALLLSLSLRFPLFSSTIVRSGLQVCNRSVRSIKVGAVLPGGATSAFCLHDGGRTTQSTSCDVLTVTFVRNDQVCGRYVRDAVTRSVRQRLLEVRFGTLGEAVVGGSTRGKKLALTSFQRSARGELRRRDPWACRDCNRRGIQSVNSDRACHRRRRGRPVLPRIPGRSVSL